MASARSSRAVASSSTVMEGAIAAIGFVSNYRYLDASSRRWKQSYRGYSPSSISALKKLAITNEKVTPKKNATGNLLSLSLSHRLCQRRNHLEQIPHHAVIGDLEDRRVLILIDRDHRLRPLHPNQVLNRPRNPDRQIKLRRHRLPRAPHLPLHRQPAVVADRPARR